MLAEGLIECMHVRRLNIQQLSDRSGVHRGLIERMRKGYIRHPRLDTLWKLADVLDVSLDELTGREGSPFSNDNLSKQKG